MLFEILDLILGIGFGFFHHGKEDYAGIFRNGAIAAIVMGIVLAFLSTYVIPNGTSIDVGFLGVFGIFIDIIIFVIIFILGAFIGDKLDPLLKK
jgi:hypothetical protein